MIVLSNENEKLSSEETSYWMRQFKALLKIGTEMEFGITGAQISELKRSLTENFGTSETFIKFGKSGIASIGSDSSIGDNSCEMRMCGRRIDFNDWYVQYYQICSEILRFGTPRIDNKCGFHNHLLIDHGSDYINLEKSVPGIIIKNFYQYFRMHLPEFIWLTSTCQARGNTNEITRRKHYCDHDGLLSTTPINKTTKVYLSAFTDHYKALSSSDMRYESEDKISTLHFENRTPDGSIFPLQISTMACIYAAVMYLSIRVSEFGLISTNGDWEETKTLSNAIRSESENGQNAPATTQENLNRIKERASEMLIDLKPYLDSISSRIYYFAQMLNENPISIRRRTKTCKEIIEEDHKIVSAIMLSEQKYDYLVRIIVLQSIEANTIENWTRAVADASSKQYEEVRKDLNNLNRFKAWKFDFLAHKVVFIE